LTVRRGKLKRTIDRLAGRTLGRAARRQRERSMVRVMGIAGRVLGMAAALLVIASFSVQAWRIGSANYSLHRQIDQVEDQNRQLAADSVKLREDIILSRNPEYLVPLIHEQLGLTKPHEVFIEVAPSTQK
jgi:cell division protein FtsB